MWVGRAGEEAGEEGRGQVVMQETGGELGFYSKNSGKKTKKGSDRI